MTTRRKLRVLFFCINFASYLNLIFMEPKKKLFANYEIVLLAYGGVENVDEVKISDGVCI